MTTRRKLLKAAAVAPAAAIATPVFAQAQITWRMQTYAGPALAEHVVKPAIDMFNKIAGERMQIELFFADQLVPTGELFRAMQRGTIDAVQSDDDSMASPTEVTVFGGYFPFASRYSLDVPVLFNQYGLKRDLGCRIRQGRREAYFGGRLGPPATSPPRTRSTRWPTCRASGSSPSRRRAGFLPSSGSFPSRCPGKTSRSPSRPVSSTGSPGRASPRTTRSAGPM